MQLYRNTTVCIKALNTMNFVRIFQWWGKCPKGPIAPPLEHTVPFCRINFWFLLIGELLFTLEHPYVIHIIEYHLHEPNINSIHA